MEDEERELEIARRAAVYRRLAGMGERRPQVSVDPSAILLLQVSTMWRDEDWKESDRSNQWLRRTTIEVTSPWILHISEDSTSIRTWEWEYYRLID